MPIGDVIGVLLLAVILAWATEGYFEIREQPDSERDEDDGGWHQM